MNSRDGEAEIKTSVERSSLRRDLRYRFAELLTIENFDEALSEALVAYSKGEILRSDLTFVIGIVRTAERMGRLKIDPARIPAEFFHSEPDVEYAQSAGPSPTPPQNS